MNSIEKSVMVNDAESQKVPITTLETAETVQKEPKVQEQMIVSSFKPDQKSNNRITNTKYNVITFLPLVFWNQIREPSSFVFFIIMMLQAKKTFAIGSFVGSLTPFLFVLVMSMLTEGVDDLKRFRRDKTVNSEKYQKVCRVKQDSTKKETHASNVYISPRMAEAYERAIDVTSEKIKVGDIIIVKKGQKFPSDCIILGTNDENGELFIRTDQLDGETDWKRRQACVDLPNIRDEIIATCELPHKDIYAFTGKLEQKTAENDCQISLDLEYTAWADTVAATSDAVGLVIHTGFQTRAKMNTYLPRSKAGLLDKEISRFVTLLVFVCCICAVTFSALRITAFDTSALIIFVRFIILFSFMIPIALKVTIDTGRMAYAYYADKKIVIRNTTIQEELGRISFFLTDKTGTLTQNEMIMKKIHLGTMCYDEKDFGEIKDLLRRCMLKKKVSRQSKQLGQKIFDLLETLALCHNVTPVETEDGIALQASSPDEVALVEFVREMGINLIYRDRSVLKVSYTPHKRVAAAVVEGEGDPVEVVEDSPSMIFEYKIHHIFPFNSDTKRMGIILERDDGSFVFFEKGADTAMKNIVKDNDWAEEETDDMARDGLRTLLIAKKELTVEQFTNFNNEYLQAKLTVTNRKQNMLDAQKKLERGLDLLGITGVEDLLQDQVKETLESLRNAGIKIWMLTGDKIETAISIAKSSRLLAKTDNYLIISGCTTENEIRDKIDALKTNRYNSLVIDGISLAVILDNKANGEDSRNYLLEAFVEHAKNLSAVIGCRYTPTQKAMMAKALKEMAGETVLCIGDGGNDVSMITEADTGVGIEGKEGNQAALSADFSLKKFCHVTDLLFIHGRGCYVKSASLAKVTLQRSLIITVVQAVFSALVNYVPLSIFQGFMSSTFILLTCFPILTLYKGHDIKDEMAMKYPELYKELRMNKQCSWKEMFTAVLVAYLQAVIISIGYMLVLDTKEMHFYSVVVFTSAVLNEYVTILLFNKVPQRATIIVILLSIVAFIGCSQVMPEFHIGALTLLKFTPQILLINLMAAGVYVALKVYKRYLVPSSHVKIAKYKSLDE